MRADGSLLVKLDPVGRKEKFMELTNNEREVVRLV